MRARFRPDLVAAFAIGLGLAAAGQACAAAHPSLAGTWVPDTADQRRQVTANAPPWTAAVKVQADKLTKEESEGRPFLVLQGCLPHGMPSLMLIMHNAFEILENPGRVTMLGEGEGNNLRRVYTDGRKHPADPDENLFGHSIGRWEGDTFVVDTVGVSPEAFVAVSEGVGIPNNGDMHIVERFHIVGKNSLHDDMTIEAPHILTKPWKTTRLYTRSDYEIIEGECTRGNFKSGKDQYGNSVLLPRPQNADGTIGSAQ